ncbi:hypothetical protein BpHYR1_034864 [Brachionus plicatilis]|uniref:Uncharacterized protein n=1 Tax=Brachionus plicatilis TaxID=10195 RepID=A0A3M7SHF8_BRAPC|nr:hypothetical protein BpHYR1_034864 [Brachionus plicatilis]
MSKKEFESLKVNKIVIITFEGKFLVDFKCCHFDNVFSFKKSRMYLRGLGQTASIDDNFVVRVNFVTALQQDIEIWRICDKYSMKSIQHWTSYDRVAGHDKLGVSVHFGQVGRVLDVIEHILGLGSGCVCDARVSRVLGHLGCCEYRGLFCEFCENLYLDEPDCWLLLLFAAELRLDDIYVYKKI